MNTETPISTEILSSFPPNSNPFIHELFLMGTAIGKDVLVMHEKHEGNKYLIVIHIPTGRRIRIDFDPKQISWSKINDDQWVNLETGMVIYRCTKRVWNPREDMYESETRYNLVASFEDNSEDQDASIAKGFATLEEAQKHALTLQSS